MEEMSTSALPEPILDSIPVEGATYRDFTETARWAVSLDGCRIGEIWRAERSYIGQRKPVVCWMKKPDVLGVSLTDTAVITGYGRTSRKGCAQQLVSWHMNRGRKLLIDGWELHCSTSRDDDLTYLGVHPKLGWRWIHASCNRELKPYRGAMGGLGWQITGYRGIRMVIVHDAPSLDGGLELLIANIGRKPDPADAPKHPPISGLSVERHYPQPEPGLSFPGR